MLCNNASNWPFTDVQVLLPHREDVKLEFVVVSEKYLAAFERINGLQVSSRLIGKPERQLSTPAITQTCPCPGWSASWYRGHHVKEGNSTTCFRGLQKPSCHAKDH